MWPTCLIVRFSYKKSAICYLQTDERDQHARQAAGAAAERGVRRQAAHAQREEGRAAAAGRHHRPLRRVRQLRARTGTPFLYMCK